MREIAGGDELKGARIRDSDLSGAQLRGVNFSNVSITDAWLFNSSISGLIGGLTINGVAVEPLIEAELDRRHPERVELRPTDLAGVLHGFDVVDEMWAPTIARARELPREQLHVRVDGEYSFVETLRHLIFATDSWITRIVLRVPNAHHELAMAPDLPPDAPPDDGPELDAVLEIRAERASRIRAHLADTTEADLARIESAPDTTSQPQGSHRVLDCFLLVFREEWWHHQYATRDLAKLPR